MALTYRGNFVTPLNTLGLSIDLPDMNPNAHTAIFGNDDARPSRMLKGLIEYDLSSDRKVIAIGFNTSYAGLATGQIEVVDLTRINPLFRLDAGQADILAELVVDSPYSFAIDVGGLEPGPAARIIERVAARLSTRETLIRPTTLAIDLIDVATPRRRMGLDADAVQQLNSFLGRSFDLGARLIMAANAPSEMPLEYVRGTIQAIFTRVTGDAVNSVAKFFKRDEQRLLENADRKDIGLTSIQQLDYWFDPMTDDAYGPYLIKLPALVTAVGDRDQSKRKNTSTTNEFCEKYDQKVAEAAEAKETSEIERQVEDKLRKHRIAVAVNERFAAQVSLEHPTRKRASNRKTSNIVPLVTKNQITVKQVDDMLKAAGMTHRTDCRARCVVSLAQLEGEDLSLTEAVSRARSEEVGTAVRYGETLYNAGMFSKGMASAICYRYIQEDCAAVDQFRLRLLAGIKGDKDPIGAAGYWLRSVNLNKTPHHAESRYKTIAKAWRDRGLMKMTLCADNDQGKTAAVAA